MCGIVAVLGATPRDDLRRLVLQQARKLRHRGPDWSGLHEADGALLAHERLAIVDPVSGGQPLLSPDGAVALTVNGEIYNHHALRAEHPDYAFATGSDCEVILPLWQAVGPDAVHRLDGVFAFVLHDASTGRWMAARDPIGVVPLYWGRDADGGLWFASELKALHDVCERFDVFPPGHVWTDADDGPRRWYEPDWFAPEVPARPGDGDRLRAAFETAVVKRLMSDVPWGVLLSGGLDSSLVSSVAARHAHFRVEDDEQSEAWWPRLHSFSVGLTGSPDLAAAAKVAEFLGTVHHGFEFTIEEGLDALPDVIEHIETFDVTSIRASTPMYLMARRIKAMGVKMVLSGEGADEMFAGYLYFHKAPDGAELHRESVRKLQTLHLYDCLRANKAMSAFGVEVRTPFLDKDFLAEAMTVDPTVKLSGTHPDGRRMEKHYLRSAFDDAEEPWLPQEILWRQKEQFSDGVGYGWIDALRDYAARRVSDDQLAGAATRWPEAPPATKEAYLYRSIFEDRFPHPSAAATVPGGKSIACSTPAAIAWDEAFANAADPSGRAVAGVHDDAWSD